ncbi:MAG: Xaa-Pro peptidase family protein [Nitrososphaerota archaeon]|nr:Xaa-Pro peptidase family protein [Nitrososphaerota archaeon]
MPLFNVDWESRIDYNVIRKYRVERVIKKMQEYDLDAILACRVENVRYITGHRPLWWPHAGNVTRNSALVSKDGRIIAFVASGDLDRARKAISWIDPKDIRALAALEDPGIIRNSVEKIFVPALKEMGVDKGRIGLDAGTFLLFEALRNALPNANFVDGDSVINEAKAIKSNEEVKAIKLACLGADEGMFAALDTVAIGVRECEVLAEAMRAMYRLGMEIPQCNLIVASGDHTAPLHRFASDKLIQYGDLVLLDLGGCFNGYFAEGTRTVIVGKPTKEQKEIYTLVYRMMNQITKSLKPGLTNEELAQAVKGVLEGSEWEKYQFFGILGHGIGISPFEYPLVREIAMSGGKNFKFEPGMVFAFEPGLFVPGIGGVRLENTIVVTETGNEVLNKVPYDENLIE